MDRRTVIVCLVALCVVANAGAVSADGEPEANYTLEFPHTSDHYPGDENPENASMHHFASVGQDLAEAEGAPNGFEVIHHVGIRNAAFDFSACSSDNTAVFGLDRGNNNSGTRTDEDLLKHRKDTKFGEEELVVEFFTEEDFGGEPIDVRPEDAIVAVLGAGSAGGPCYTMPEEPGWYRMHGWANGTTEDGEFVEIEVKSNYQYICTCDSEAEAREKLGPPPSEAPADETPTPAGSTPTDSSPTPTAGGDRTATPPPETESTSTATAEGGSGATATPTATSMADESTATSERTATDEESRAGGAGTPTPADGSGFGVLAVLLAVAGLLLVRRDRWP